MIEYILSAIMLTGAILVFLLIRSYSKEEFKTTK
ncbi:hypothetical protein AAX27_01236 [Aliarcobacter thereius]|nr:hypothetical protein AAX27_01236 [Aliarcobacter thereius]